MVRNPGIEISGSVHAISATAIIIMLATTINASAVAVLGIVPARRDEEHQAEQQSGNNGCDAGPCGDGDA